VQLTSSKNEFMRILVIPITLCFLSLANCQKNSEIEDADTPVIVRAEKYWNWYHEKRETIYDGNGEWGTAFYGFKDVLRNSYWIGDVYGRLSKTIHKNSTLFGIRAKEISNYIVQAQTNGTTGVIGIPDEPNHPEFGDKIREIENSYPQGIINGWIVELPNKNITELYYDHGYALVSLCREYQRTKEPTLTTPINDAANWILNNYLISNNENYHSAVSKGLCYSYEVTNNITYLEKAVEIHKTLIIPHQQNDGMWDDDHNRRLVYHAFITSGLIALKRVLPEGHYFQNTLNASLTKAIEALVSECNTNKNSTYSESVVGWPGACIMAFIELSDIRTLTKSEKEALEIAVDFIISSEMWLNNNFNNSETLGMLRVSAPMGLYVSKFGYEK